MNPGLMLSNLIAWSLQIAVIVAAATILPGVLRLRNPAAMLAYWWSVLAVCLLLPVIQPWHVLPATSLLTSFSAELGGAGVGIGGKVTTIPVGGIIAYVLAAGVILRLLWLGLGLYRLRTVRRNASPIGSLPGLFLEMQTRVGVTIYLSSGLDSPVSFGFVRPAVIFPARLLEMEEEKQRTVVCHELLHIHRRDWGFVLIEEVIRALLWFHPAIWWALGRIQLSREQVVDREVLRITGARRAYLQALLEFAASERAEAIPALPLLKQHHLPRRVALILKEDSMTRTRLILSLTIISIILIATCGLAVKSAPLNSRLLAEGRSPEEVEPNKQTRSPKRVRSEGGILKVVHQVDPDYPPEAERNGIRGNVIAEIEVDERGQVRKARVIEGHDALNEAALNAIRQWRFSPYQFDGRAVPIVARWTFNFSLKK